MGVMEFHIQPQGEVLEAYYVDRSQCSFIMGPLGSAKTTTTCQKIFNIMCEQEPNDEGIRPSRWYAIRNTYPDLMTTTVKDWLELTGTLGRFTQGGIEPPTQRLDFELEDGTKVVAEMVFIALDRPEHIKKLRGTQVTGFWLSEAKELVRAVVDMADARHGRYPSMAAGGVRPTWHGMLGDTNAPDDDSWYYEMAEETKPEGWKFFRQPGGIIQLADKSYIPNPNAENLANLPDGYYKRMLNGSKKADWLKVNAANEYGFVMEGKPVMPEYVDSLHCQETEYNPLQPINIGMDFGLSPAAVFSQRGPMGQVRVLSELVATRLGAKNFAREIKAHLADRYPGATMGTITGDPAGEQGNPNDESDNVFKMLRSEGVNAKPANTNDFTIRREAVGDMLSKLIDGKPALIIDPSCKTLRKGMAGGYCFKRVQVVGAERYHLKPDKTPSSHVCEALQYDLLGQGIAKETIIQPQAVQQQMAARPTQAATDYDVI